MKSSSKFEVAVLTRGFSLGNDYQWKSSLLEQHDGINDLPVRQRLREVGFKNLLNGQIPGIAVSKRGQSFSVYLTDVPTSYRSTVAPGKIRICFAFFDLLENQARSIASSFLCDWAQTVEKLANGVERETLSAEWSFQAEFFEKFINELTELYAESVVQSPAQNSPHRMSYARPENGAFKEFTTHAIQKISSPGDGLKVAIGEAFDADAQARIEGAEGTIFAALPAFSKENLSPVPDARRRGNAERVVKSIFSRNRGVNLLLATVGLTILAGFFFGKKPPPKTNPAPSPSAEFHTFYSVTRAAPQLQEFRLNQRLADQLIAFRIATADEIDILGRSGGTLERESLNQWLKRFKSNGPVVDSELASKSRERITSDLRESVDKLGSILISGDPRSALAESRRVEQQLREDLLVPDQEIASWKDEKGVIDPAKAQLKIGSFASMKWPTAATLELSRPK